MEVAREAKGDWCRLPELLSPLAEGGAAHWICDFCPLTTRAYRTNGPDLPVSGSNGVHASTTSPPRPKPRSPTPTFVRRPRPYHHPLPQPPSRARSDPPSPLSPPLASAARGFACRRRAGGRLAKMLTKFETKSNRVKG
uniref:Uncharacterized protein n=1 Tax=Oryza punctata TaxID=4537 RepID=A0A0E0LYG6_ORYPU